MPLPKPNQGESRDGFITRCVGDAVMNEEFPDKTQRTAVCERRWTGGTAMSSVFICASGKPFVAKGDRQTINGQPVQKFKKTVIKRGEWFKASTNQKVHVDLSMLEHWAETFAEMKSNGIRVPIPSTHAGDGNPDMNRGYVDHMRIEGDELVMECSMIGEDGILAAARSDVSIHSPAEFIDGNGIRYHQPITHVALCTDPVVPGLGAFVPIAASHQGGHPVEWLKKLAELLGVKEFKQETAEQQLSACASELVKTNTSLSQEKKTLEEKILELTNQVKTISASSGNKSKPDATLVSLAADNRKMKLDGLVAAARITPAVRDQMAALYIGPSNSAVELSLQHGTQSEFDKLIGVLSLNDPVALKEKTGPQSLSLSNPNNGEGESDLLVKDAERRAAAKK